MPPKTAPADKPENEKPEDSRTLELRPGEKPGDGAKSGKDRDESPAEKVAAAVEPVTDALASVEKLIRGQADAFKVALELGDVEAHELASDFEAKAADLARAALANVEGRFAAGSAERGYDAGLKPVFPSPEHNEHAVRSAVAHGMDEEKARAMTHSGANT